VSATTDDPALLVGLEAPDDAAVYRVAPEVALVQTVDFFTPIVDDAFDWGRIAAANALSDVYAMGGHPLTAMNLVAWPRKLSFEILGRVIDGASDGCREAGVAIVGGHSIDDPEPKFGLAVTGTVHPDRVVRKTGARAGADLVLTKPLGMGVISSGIKEQKTSAPTIKEATRIMSELNAAACDAMLEVGVDAATDVTGYGLIGHLVQMLEGTSAELLFSQIPILEEAFELAGAGVVPGGSRRNIEALAELVSAPDLDEEQRIVLFDAQTSGGLLIAVAPDRLRQLMSALAARGVDRAAHIGRLVGGDGSVTVIK
jgi:selenide,water dikinase